MIAYQGSVYRPPSEANSLILQATLGCSWNRCSFCGMYRDKKFRIRPIEDLYNEIDLYSAYFPPPKKVFLADGDALMAKSSFLGELLDYLAATWPKLQRVSCYASPQALAVRSIEEMTLLREKGLRQYYLGVESGNDQVLTKLEKGVDAATMVHGVQKANAADVRLSVMILLGVGETALSQQHAQDSAKVLNQMQPRFVSTLVVTPVEGTPLWTSAQKGTFEALSPVALAAELREFLVHLDLKASIFRSNHASNYLALAGTLPKDQNSMVTVLDEVLAHPENAPFRPEWLRAL